MATVYHFNEAKSRRAPVIIVPDEIIITIDIKNFYPW